MRKLLYAFIILSLIPTISFAGSLQQAQYDILGMYGAAGAAAPSAMCDLGCNGVADADLFCEDMDGSPGSCTWTTSGTGVDFDSASGYGDLSCSVKGDSVAEVIMATGADHYTYYAYTGTTTVYEEFYVRISSTNVDTDGEYQLINWLSNGAVVAGIYIQYTTDHIEWAIFIDGGRTLVGTDGTVALNTWYKLTLTYIAETSVSLDVNEVNVYTDSSVAQAGSVTASVFGGANAQINQDTTFQFAVVKADNDTEPAVCE